MPEHYSLIYHEVEFLPFEHKSFPDADLQDLGQVSKRILKVVSKDAEVVHENF